MNKLAWVYYQIKGCIKYRLFRTIYLAKALKYVNAPLENKVVFCNFNGRGFGDNPKYIAMELLRRENYPKLVWLVNSMDEEVPFGVEKALFMGKDSFYHLGSAKVIINNVKGELNFIKKKSQLYIQTWHGGFGIKCVEKDAADQLPWGYLLESMDNSRITDVFLSNSNALSEGYRRAFWCKSEIMECGFPRNDLYFNSNEDDKNKIREKLGIPANKKICMYAPTFRGADDTLESYGLDFEFLLNTLKTDGSWVLLLRQHPNIKIDSSEVTECADVMNVSTYPDMQELLLIMDILITDYSSTFLEAAEMKKPAFLFSNDLEEYQQGRRMMSSYFEFDLPRSYTNEELNSQVKAYLDGTYVFNFEGINAEFNTFDDGLASKRVADRIMEFVTI